LDTLSPGINAGTTLAQVPDDLLGVSRPQGIAFDIGAYEYTPGLADTTPPAAITDLSASTGSNSGEIDLRWTAPGDDGTAGTATAYTIKYATTPITTDAEYDASAGLGTEPVPAIAGTVQSMTATGLSPGVRYYFAIKARDEAYNRSAISNSPSALAKTNPTTPTAPSNLAATAVSTTQINLSWSDNSSDESGFKIERKTGASGTYAQVATTNADSITYSDTGLSPGTTYYYRVRAYNASGDSTYSNETSATTHTFTLTLEAENMATKTTGASTTGGWNIYANGYIEDTVQFPATGVYRFDIIAKGQVAVNVWPNMGLRIDQSTKASFTVNTTGWATYTANINVTQGSHKVAVAFTNDYYKPPADRNLYVDKVTITKN
jgi:hypothetical protein